MRIPNLRLHATSLGIICAAITVVYFIFAPHESKVDTRLHGDRYIQIDSASWGLNCNPYVDDALRQWTPSDDPENPSPKPHLAMENNALSAVSEACNGKLSCKFTPTPRSVGDDPLLNCPKILAVRYRCFTFDKLNSEEFRASDDLEIDCTPKPQNTNAPKNQH